MTQTSDSEAIREAVRTRYAAAAVAASAQTSQSSCCGTTSSCCGSAGDASVISSDLYSIDELTDLPDQAVLASLGCGNPTALAELRPRSEEHTSELQSRVDLVCRLL